MAGQPYGTQQAYNGAAGQPFGAQPYGAQPGYNNAAGQPYGAQSGYSNMAGQPYAPQQMNNGTSAQSCGSQPQASGGVVRKVPCPFCGEMTTPTADGRCEFCLGKVY